ncbi:TonB family protein [Pedobacter sp. UYP24]
MSWAHYILQVNIYLLVFYGFYKLLLDKETYFTLNRCYLVAAGILSLTIPFLRFEWFSAQPIAQPVYVTVGQVSDYMYQVGTIQDDLSVLTPGNMLALLYMVGVVFFIIRLVVRLIHVRLLLKRNESGMAFSFFGRNMIDATLPGFHTINSHEEIHIRQLHSLDVLFFEVLGIIAWFNPIIYFYKHTVKNIHEYLADEEAANFQGDKEQYALLLLSSAFGVTPSNLTNSFFNKSLIKKRIYMLHKQRSKKTAILKYGLFLPLFAITLVMSSATLRTNKKIQLLTEDIPLNQPLQVVKEVVAAAIEDVPAGSNSEKVDFSDLLTHLKRSVRYPPAASASGVQGFSMIKFTVKNGEPNDVSIASTALGYGCDTELMSKILTYDRFKKIADGKYVIKTSFILSGNTSPLKNQNLQTPANYTLLPDLVIRGYIKTSNSATDLPDNKVYDFVSLEQQPTFPGGMDKFYGYLKSTLAYPEEAKANKVEGKVFLSFVVEKDGSLSDIKVERKLGSGTDEEAVRVLKLSPAWTPGIQNGNKVRVKYNIPISFSLESSSTITVNAVPTPENKVYDFVSLDQQPTFEGGMDNFYKYLSKTVKYPADAQKLNKQGKVFLSFVVEKDGALTDIKVERGVGFGLDEEAVRVMKASPKWIPGIQNGKKVRVKYNIPLNFTLTK